MLLATDLTARVIKTDLESFALLLLNTASVDPEYPRKLLTSLAPSKAIETALKRSGIRGIQLLLWNLASVAPEFLQAIAQSLWDIDLGEKIAKAKIKDTGNLLWNTYAHVGQELAQHYCRIVDTSLPTDQITNSDFKDLGGFLWNLVHIGNLEKSRILDLSELRERLRREWETQPDQCLSILGIIATLHPLTVSDLALEKPYPGSTSGRFVEHLTKLLNDRHPYEFALNIRGLQALDQSQAAEIIRHTLQDKYLVDIFESLFQETMELAVTPRSREVLDHITSLIRRIREAND
jgi:hypothetical protein